MRSARAIFNKEIQQFINANLKVDLHSLLLKKSPFQSVSMQEIVQQIKGRNIAEKKFPFLLKHGIVFPPNLNLEQASSESTARFKSSLIQGKSIVDLTAGFGVDAYFLSKNFENITLIEQNFELLEIVENNWKILGKKAEFINQNLEDFLENNSKNFDLVYLDPARRDSNKNKVFLLEDLSPNLLQIQEILFEISDNIFIKLSPLIDISYLLSMLKNVEDIYIVAVKNEVKEILVKMIATKNSANTKIHCVNLETDQFDLIFDFNDISLSEPSFSEIAKYLYIPNNAILKSGAFNLVSEKFGLKKLHSNTHLYTSDILQADFPGRIMEIKKIEAKTIKPGEQFNIISKNYPLKPEEIKKKYGLKDGGENYLIFTQDISGKIILKSK